MFIIIIIICVSEINILYFNSIFYLSLNIDKENLFFFLGVISLFNKFYTSNMALAFNIIKYLPYFKYQFW